MGTRVGVGVTEGLGETDGLGDAGTVGLGDTEGLGETDGLGDTEGLGEAEAVGVGGCPVSSMTRLSLLDEHAESVSTPAANKNAGKPRVALNCFSMVDPLSVSDISSRLFTRFDEKLRYSPQERGFLVASSTAQLKGSLEGNVVIFKGAFGRRRRCA